MNIFHTFQRYRISRRTLVEWVLLILLFGSGVAGERKWKIALGADREFKGQMLSAVIADTLSVTDGTTGVRVAINDITKLESSGNRQGIQFGTGALIGALAGAGIGILYDRIESGALPTVNGEEKGDNFLTYGLAGAAGGTLLGAALSGHGEKLVYDVSGFSLQEKSKLLDAILYSEQTLPRNPLDILVPPAPEKIETVSEINTFSQGLMRLSAGPSIPIGDFGSTKAKDDLPGGAQLGFNVTGDLGERFGPYFVGLVSLSVTSNSVNPQVLGSVAKYNPEVSNWVLIWPMVGIEVHTAPPGVLNAYGLFQGGIASGSTPGALVHYQGSTTRIESTSGSGAAYRFGIGLQAPRHGSIDLRYTLASPDFTDGGTHPDGQSVQVLTLGVGWSF